MEGMLNKLRAEVGEHENADYDSDGGSAAGVCQPEKRSVGVQKKKRKRAQDGEQEFVGRKCTRAAAKPRRSARQTGH